MKPLSNYKTLFTYFWSISRPLGIFHSVDSILTFVWGMCAFSN